MNNLITFLIALIISTSAIAQDYGAKHFGSVILDAPLATASGGIGNATGDASALTALSPGGQPLALALSTSVAGYLLDQFKQVGDADDTAALTRAAATNLPISLGARTYIINSGTVDFVLRGIPGKSIIKRTFGNGASTFFDVWSPNVLIDGVIFDMNSSAVTANQWGLRFSRPDGAQHIAVIHSGFKNNSGTVPMCLTIHGTGPNAGGSFNISDNEFNNCPTSIRLGSAAHGIISRNNIHDGGANSYGVWVQNYPDPVTPTNPSSDIIIANNHFDRLTYGVSGGQWGFPIVFNNPSISNITVGGNQFQDNTMYSVLLHGDYIKVVDNLVTQSSPSVYVFGGIDGTSRYSTYSGNTINLSGSPWALDIGGSIEASITNNTIQMNTGIIINAGGNTNPLISNNHLIVNGTATGIFIEPLEASDLDHVFTNTSSGTVIINNRFSSDGGANYGIAIKDNAGGFEYPGAKATIVKNNEFFGFGAQQNAITWAGSAWSLEIDGNAVNGSMQRQVDPDVNGDVYFDIVNFGGTIVGLTSTTNVRAIVPRYFTEGTTSIQYVTLVAPGSGYAPACWGSRTTNCTSVSASGTTGGSGWKGTPMILNGVFVGVRTTAVGTGYTGTVTIAANDSSGSGSGATFKVSQYPRLPIGATIKYQPNQTVLLQKNLGAIQLTSPDPLQLSAASEVTLQTAGNSNGLSWTVANSTTPSFASTSLPTCNSTASGAKIFISDSASGKWEARCNGINWIYSDGTTAP